jgi:hypothetical protein
MSAGFVWDDLTDFQNMAWLRHGDHWRQFLLQHFNGWTNYFRPLVVALLALEVRSFDVSPGPMHTVSLFMHMANTLLVGFLAACLSGKRLTAAKEWRIPALSMLLYGLHPALIEPVTWIACQFDLAVTLFMLLGLIANRTIQSPMIRALTVAVCFFLASSSKESAVSFPLLVAVFDWADKKRYGTEFASSLREILRQNWLVYVGLLIAGTGSLLLRFWALGALTQPMSNYSSLFGRLQEACFLYLRYWRMLFMPMIDIGPIHPWSPDQFNSVTTSSLLTCVAAIGIVLGGVYLAIRRSNLGALILAVTFALLPVLHLVPVAFDQNLYHERYVMMALAVACIFLPAVLSRIPVTAHRRTTISAASTGIAVLWLLFGIANIRLITPLWSSNVQLWQWALSTNPYSIDAKDELISAYVDRKDYGAAWRVFESLDPNEMSCVNCVLNITIAAVAQHRLEQASELLDNIKDSVELRSNKQMHLTYLTTRAQLLTLQQDYISAENTFQQAIALDPLAPEPQAGLAVVLALQGNYDAAAKLEYSAILLLPPIERESRKQAFADLLSMLRSDRTGSREGIRQVKPGS